MFTDMVGFTALTQSDEAQSLAVLDRHNRLLRPIFPRFNGREVKAIGDSFLVEFESALDAINCALEIQRFLHDYNISSKEEWKITLRIGVHVGDVVRSDGDIIGDAVNIASRLQPLADPEGICVSDQVYGQVRNKIHQPLMKLEPRDLKGVKFSVDVYKVVMPWEESTPQWSPQLDPKRVAVLPLVSMSPDPNDEYFADGLTEELITKISLVKGLEVIARTSAMNYKKEKKNASQIGKELRVGTLLEGSVRKAGNRIRVSAQLINANTEGHLWAETYDRDLADVFEVQSGIAQNVAESLRVRLLPEVKQELQREPVRNIEAYGMYLRGLQHSDENSLEKERKALRYFENSIELDPSFYLAYLEAAKMYFRFGNMGYMEPTEARNKAEAMLAKGEAIEPDSVSVHKVKAFRCFANYDWLETDAQIRKAIELNPSDAEARRVHATVLQVMGKLDETLWEANKASELDPLWTHNWFRVSVLYYARRYDESISVALKHLDQEPEDFNSRSVLGYSYLMKSLAEEAIVEFQKNIELAREDPTNWSKGDLALAYARSGRKNEATKLLDELQMLSERRFVPPDVFAVVNWALGNTDLALRQFESAFNHRSLTWIQWLGVDPLFDHLRADPRFATFLSKVGFPVSRSR